MSTHWFTKSTLWECLPQSHSMFLYLSKDGWWEQKIENINAVIATARKAISTFLPFLKGWLSLPPLLLFLNLSHLFWLTTIRFFCIPVCYVHKRSVSHVYWAIFWCSLWLFNNTLEIQDAVISDHINFITHKWKSIVCAFWPYQMQVTSLQKEKHTWWWLWHQMLMTRVANISGKMTHIKMPLIIYI